MTQLEEAETEDLSIDHRHPRHAPVLGSRFDLVVQLLFVLEDSPTRVPTLPVRSSTPELSP